MKGRIFRQAGLIILLALLSLACKDSSPTSPSSEPIKQDIWCELNFRLTIKDAKFDGPFVRFKIEAWTWNQKKHLEIIVLPYPFQGYTKEWNVDGFKTGTKGSLVLIYMAHGDPGFNIQQSYKSLASEGDTFTFELEVTSKTSGVLINPSSFSQIWPGEVGDNATFSFSLIRN